MAPFMITRSVETARRTVLRASPRSVSSAIQILHGLAPDLAEPTVAESRHDVEA
jgi:hypothetical protein